MDDQEFYYDVSYQRTKEGPVGAMRRSKLEDVAEWLKNDTAGLHFIIILRMPGSRRGCRIGRCREWNNVHFAVRWRHTSWYQMQKKMFQEDIERHS